MSAFFQRVLVYFTFAWSTYTCPPSSSSLALRVFPGSFPIEDLILGVHPPHSRRPDRDLLEGTRHLLPAGASGILIGDALADIDIVLFVDTPNLVVRADGDLFKFASHLFPVRPHIMFGISVQFCHTDRRAK